MRIHRMRFKMHLSETQWVQVPCRPEPVTAAAGTNAGQQVGICLRDKGHIQHHTFQHHDKGCLACRCYPGRSHCQRRHQCRAMVRRISTWASGATRGASMWPSRALRRCLWLSDTPSSSWRYSLCDDMPSVSVLASIHSEVQLTQKVGFWPTTSGALMLLSCALKQCS